MPRLVRHWGGKKAFWNKESAYPDVSNVILLPGDEKHVRDL